MGSTFVRLLGWRVGFGLGVLVLWEFGAIIGEFMAASRGLGYMIQLNTNRFDTTGRSAGSSSSWCA